MSIDKKGNDHDGAIVTKQKIQSLSKNTGLYVVNFDNKMTGIDPITGKKKTLDEINGLALYNTATKSIDFKSGNSLALTAVLNHLDVNGMVEVDRLVLLGIEQLGENNPADNETSHEPDNKKQGYDARDGASLFLVVV